MNKTKAITCLAVVFVSSAAVYQAIRLHRDTSQLGVEKSLLKAQADSWPRLQNEFEQLAPVRSALAASDELKKELEARRRDQGEIKSLQKKLDDYERKEADDLDKLKRELDLLREQAQRGEIPMNTNAWYDSTVSLNIELEKANNKGAGTPENLMETWLWAVEHHNVELLRGLHVSPENIGAISAEGLLALDGSWLPDVVAISLREKSVKGNGDEARLEFDLKRDREPGIREPTILRLRLKRDGNEWKIYSVSGTRPEK